MNLRISPAKAGDVRLEAGFVEPTKHLVELFAHKESNDRHRESAKLHGPAHYPTEHLSGFNVRELAPGDLQLFPDEFLWAFECQGHKGADIVRRDGLIGPVAAKRICQLSF